MKQEHLKKQGLAEVLNLSDITFILMLKMYKTGIFYLF